MKKNNKIKNGFVMSELLAASIVILLLFTILFANYLPLVGEFEKRSLYNNVTSNYGLFYARKIYINALEDSNVKNTLKVALNTNSFYKVYDSDSQTDPSLITDENQKSELMNIINKYGIEEMIITKYKLDDVKGKNGKSDAPAKYKKSDGKLYNYIKYLPLYKRAQYGNDQISEPFRLIVKTKKYGYATTQIIPDPPTPINCFSLKKTLPGEFSILGYDEDCGEDVTVTADEIIYNNEKGIITSIVGSRETENNQGAFEGKDIKTVYLSSKVKNIGDNAFKNNRITKIDFSEDAKGVTQIGANAFSDNNLKSVSISSNITSIGEGAFANNYNLSSIEIEYKENAPEMEIPKNLFALSDESKLTNKKIDLFIPHYVRKIGEGAFKNLQFSSIDFEDEEFNESVLQEIGASAFQTKFEDSDNYVEIAIPHTVQTIGANAFENTKIGSLIFKEKEGVSSLKSIGSSAFKVQEVNINKINKEQFCSQDIAEGEETECSEYIRGVRLPTSVEEIGASAFQNQALSAMIFEETSEDGNIAKRSNLIKVGNQAFAGNSFNSITLPESFGSSSAQIGNKIFGDNFSLGNQIGQITIRKDLLDGAYWCTALYGTSCTASEYIEDESEDAGDDDSKVYMYKNGSTTKYISYTG